MIANNLILTNAHAVEYASLIQVYIYIYYNNVLYLYIYMYIYIWKVKKRQSETKFLASVLAVGHECDLALLKIQDSSFWHDTKPLELGNLPDLLEDVIYIYII